MAEGKHGSIQGAVEAAVKPLAESVKKLADSFGEKKAADEQRFQKIEGDLAKKANSRGGGKTGGQQQSQLQNQGNGEQANTGGSDG